MQVTSSHISGSPDSNVIFDPQPESRPLHRWRPKVTAPPTTKQVMSLLRLLHHPIRGSRASRTCIESRKEKEEGCEVPYDQEAPGTSSPIDLSPFMVCEAELHVYSRANSYLGAGDSESKRARERASPSYDACPNWTGS